MSGGESRPNRGGGLDSDQEEVRDWELEATEGVESPRYRCPRLHAL